MKAIPKIILASRSIRRKEILEHLGLDIEIKVSGADENIDPHTPPGLYTEILSLRKAEAVLPCPNDKMIIASDTIVYAGGEILGKPHDREDAIRMLTLLSGNVHTVYSGVAVIYNGETYVTHDETEVIFRPLDREEIERYVDSGEPFDKAGGYGIQDRASVFIQGIKGDYFNVVGLPVYKMFEILKEKFGIIL